MFVHTYILLMPTPQHIYFHLYLNIYAHHYHHHHDVPLALISQTLHRHSSLSSIAFGRSSRLHLVSTQISSSWSSNTCLWSMSLMSSSLLLQKCAGYLVTLIWIVLEREWRWPCSCWFVECFFQDSFITARSILCQWMSSFLSESMLCICIVVRSQSQPGKMAFYFIRQVWPRYDQ